LLVGFDPDLLINNLPLDQAMSPVKGSPTAPDVQEVTMLSAVIVTLQA